MSNYEPKLVKIEELTVAGISVRTINKDEFDPKTAKLGAFWEQFRRENIPATIPNAVANSAVYGVYHDYDSDASGYYTVTAGVEVQSPAQLNREFTKVTIPAGQYLVFSAKGSMPQVVIDVWQRIWEYFSKENPYERLFNVDFELYPSAEEVAIYIGVSY